MRFNFRNLVLLFAVVGITGSLSLAKAEDNLRIMTFNIRYNNPDDGENAWPNRKVFATNVIRYNRVDIVGLQEALAGQVEDLEKRLPEFSWFGVGRDDGKKAGEFMAIFYLKDRLDLLESNTFWLSETPDEPGIGWDAACNRVVTWGKFRDKITGKVFFHFNTHFDHKGETARRESAYLLISRVSDIAGDSPAVITGDFNAQPSSEPYKIITSLADCADKLIDSINVSRYSHYGPSGTWSGFESNSAKKAMNPLIIFL